MPIIDCDVHNDWSSAQVLLPYGEILRCGWHGWEFEIASGVCLVDKKVHARSYPVTVEMGIWLYTFIRKEP